MDTIDIRDWKQTGEALKLAIEQAVADTQSVIIRTLPNKLVMTQAQYTSLEHDPEMKAVMLPGFEGSTDRLWLTKHNLMDVIIKGVA